MIDRLRWLFVPPAYTMEMDRPISIACIREAIAGDAANAGTALKFAAATMEAQQRADDQFVEFRLRYTKRIDGPVLRWSRRYPRIVFSIEPFIRSVKVKNPRCTRYL